MDDDGPTDDELAALADAVIALATRPEPLPNPADEAIAVKLVAAYRTFMEQVAALLAEWVP